MAKKETYTAKIRATRTQETIEVPVLENFVDIKIPTKHFFNNGNFITIFQKALRNIAMFGNLTKNENTLLLYLIGSCGSDNSVCIDLNLLTQDLGIDKGNISRALKGLVSRNIVLRRDGYRCANNPLPMELSLNYDQINYNVAYNGRTKDFSKKRDTHPPITDKDGCTLLESHKEGEPVRIMQKNRELLIVAEDGTIIQDPNQLNYEQTLNNFTNEKN